MVLTDIEGVEMQHRTSSNASDLCLEMSILNLDRDREYPDWKVGDRVVP
jgi:hypothetical protein